MFIYPYSLSIFPKVAETTKMRYTNPVSKLLINGKSRRLQRLSQFSNQLAELSALVQSCLPTPLQGHCQVINIRGKALILQTESAAWASQLRFYTPAMLSTLPHHHSNHLQEIHIRIKPLSAKKEDGTRCNLAISSQSATLITGLAEITPHRKLQESLLRLASRKQNNS